MTDNSGAPHAPNMEPARRKRRVVSAVWLVPIVAVLIALAIAWQSYSNRGVLIRISFPDASGVTIGQTTLRYREVTVGVVEDVGFSEDLSRVNVYVRVSNNIAPYLDEDAAFWVVQPEVSARGVEGLNTILSGTYIEGTWDSDLGASRVAFMGDERAPIVPPGVDGTAIVLSSRESSRLGPGAPILYRGIEVGQVAEPRLSPDGSEIRIDAFIRAPYDRQLSTATRFWDASGITVGVGTGGVDLRIGSLASILEGGVNFDTLISGGDAVESGTVFTIFPDEAEARASTFEAPSTRSITLSALFPGALDGLASGAPVRYRGVRVGTVTAITGFVRPDDRVQRVQLLAVMSLQPVKMGLEDMQTDLEGLDYIGDLVEGGLRAKLVSTSLFGGSLAIELLEVPDVPADRLEIGVADNPLIPTVATEASTLTANAEGVFNRISELPVEELLTSATDLLESLNRLAGAPETQAIPGAALAAIEDGRGLIRDGRDILDSPEVASVLVDIETAAGNISALTESLTRDNLTGRVGDALSAATDAARNIADGTVDLPAIAANINTLVANADVLLADESTRALPSAALALVEDGSRLIASPELTAILSDLAATSADIRAITAQLAAQEAGARLTAALSAAEDAAVSVAEGTRNLPELSARAERILAQAEELGAGLNRLTTKAEGLALDELVNATTSLMQTADAFLSSDEADDVPVVLVQTLEELRRTIETIRTGGTIDNLNATLRSTAGAADSIAQSAQDLPTLVAQLQTLTNQAGGLLQAYGDGSRVNTELFAALRAATRAAEDVSSLSRTIERNPNSLLLGR
ncbi:MAG: MlaD family protein [Jannaschia sp.]